MYRVVYNAVCPFLLQPCWARSRVALADASKEQRETAILLGKFQAILNKLTPQRFQRLAEQALALDINTEKRLKGCVDLITERVEYRGTD